MGIFKKTKQRGFTLLLASLIASLLLAIGLSMFTVAQKEIILSGLGRESQYAFYAADAGAECALYWDFKKAFDPLVPTYDAKCNNIVVGQPYGDPPSLVLGGQPFDDNGESITEFYFEQNNRCVNVTVTKFETGNITTKIDSRGYNVRCDASGEPIITPRTLERAVRMVY